jgi:hypothetical protein
VARRKIPTILAALDTLDDSTARTLRSTPLLRTILVSRPSLGGRRITASLPLRQQRRQRVYPRRVPSRLTAGVGNIDLAVLRPENQHPTHVTPRIAALATGLFREQLVVLGRRLPPPRSRMGTRVNISKRERSSLVNALAMALCAEGTQKIEAPVSWRVHPRRPFMHRVALCDVRGLLPRVVFEVGFFFLTLGGCGGKASGLNLFSRSETSCLCPSERTMRRRTMSLSHYLGSPSLRRPTRDLLIISGTFSVKLQCCVNDDGNLGSVVSSISTARTNACTYSGSTTLPTRSWTISPTRASCSSPRCAIPFP